MTCWVAGCTQTVTLICRDRNDREWLVCTDCGEQSGWVIVRPYYSMVVNTAADIRRIAEELAGEPL